MKLRESENAQAVVFYQFFAGVNNCKKFAKNNRLYPLI
ncbi:hypothetical protein MHD_01805 [Mannheimia granulomatis]|uniref:Uncharacterized protein n=1 Tax=Mannheimia granulomatis TaxID=85402 RepID=A0A011PAA9_9PAST|nr:hypothetical protein AK33_00390 [Mannheimia granulomatis]RGE48704.1 hypothetical protein MHD_01805 [Mannheimia granulomatis]